MNNEWRALDRIEQATQQQPYCICGQPTTPVAQPDGLWLECTTIGKPVRGWRHSLLRALTGGAHVRRQILDCVSPAA